MTRRSFGGGAADFVAKIGVGQTVIAQPSVSLTMWTAPTGGTQITDLLNHAGSAASSITADSYGNIATFSGPDDGTTIMWADTGVGSTRVALYATDTADRVTALETQGLSHASIIATLQEQVGQLLAGGPTPPVNTSIVFTEDFTGTDGSAPASSWTVLGGTGATIDIQSNMLRVMNGSTAWSTQTYMYRNTMTGITATTLLANGVRFQNPKVQQYLILGVQASSSHGGEQPSQGYFLALYAQENEIHVFRGSGNPSFGATDLSGAISYTFTAGTDVNVLFTTNASGGLAVTVWNVGSSQPSTPNWAGSDSVWAGTAGVVAIGAQGGASTLAWKIDQLVVSNTSSSTPTPPTPSTGFVTRTGQALMRSGVEIRPGSGINAPDLCAEVNGVWGPTNIANRTAFMQAMSGRVVRFMAFAGVNTAIMDSVMDLADTYNVLLLPYLCDEANGGLDPAGPNGKTSTWYISGWTGAYKTHLGTMAARYSNRKCILAWELVNEPGTNSWNHGLHQFFIDATSYLKAQDPNHLVFAGNFAEWPYSPTAPENGETTYLNALLAGTNTDAVCVHEYDAGGASSHATPVAHVAHDLSLPWYVGEFGDDGSWSAMANASARVTAFNTKNTAYSAATLSGYKGAAFMCYWSYREDTSVGPNILAGNASAPFMAAIDGASAWTY